MLLCAVAGWALQGSKVASYESVLGVSKPQTLWVKPGDVWNWPSPLDKAHVKFAMWRTAGGQSNILELPTASNMQQVAEGVALAGVDYAPVKLPDGRTLEATEQWIVRSGASKTRPMPSGVVTAKAGLRTEIRLFMDPTATILGGDIALKLYDEGGGSSEDADEGEFYDGDFTITTPNGETRTMHTGPQGLSAFKLDQAGIWVVRFTSVHDNVVRSGSLWFQAGLFTGAK